MQSVEAKSSPVPGQIAPASILIDVEKLLDQYYTVHPDP